MGGATIQKARADSTLWRGICTVRDTNRPNPRSEYVERLRRSVAGFKFGPPDVQVTVTGKNRRPLGVAIAEITVRTKEGDEVPATHRSYWAWQPGPPAGQIIGGGVFGPSRGPTDWYISSDEMHERRASASSDVRSLSLIRPAR